MLEGDLRDADGDTTMVNQSEPGSPTDGILYPSTPTTPTHTAKASNAWTPSHIPRTPTDPPFTQMAAATPQSQSPIPQLPEDLTRTPTPVGGFPIIHLSTPPWFNLLPEQRATFDQYPGPKLWIWEWQASNAADLMVASDRIKDLLQNMTGERVKLSTLQQEKNIITKKKYDKQKPPYHFLISNITEEAGIVLLTHPIVSTPDASVFILPYNPPLPSFLCTVEGFTLSIQNQSAIRDSEDTATEIIRRNLLNNEALVNLLKGKLLDDGTSQHNLEPAISIISTLRVELARGEETVDHMASYKPRRPLWNVFFRSSPPITWMS